MAGHCVQGFPSKQADTNRTCFRGVESELCRLRLVLYTAVLVGHVDAVGTHQLLPGMEQP